MFDDLGIVLRKIFQENFKRAKEEKILFLSDIVSSEQENQISPLKRELIENRTKFVELLSIRCRDLYGTDKVSLITYPCTLKHGEEPPAWLISEIEKHDIFIAMPSFSLTYTESIQTALKAGVRGASMPLVNPELFKVNSGLMVNIQDLENLGRAIIQKIQHLQARESNHQCLIKIEDENGTSFEFSILQEKQTFIENYGNFHEPMSFGNLPAGEIFTVPDIFGQAHGKIVIHHDNTKYCQDDCKLLEMELKEGKIVNIQGAKSVLDEYLGFSKGPRAPTNDEIQQSRRNFALFGIGLNKKIESSTNILERSKKFGACHIGLGASTGIGGSIKSDLHLGFVLPSSSISVNGSLIVEKGKLLEI